MLHKHLSEALSACYLIFAIATSYWLAMLKRLNQYLGGNELFASLHEPLMALHAVLRPSLRHFWIVFGHVFAVEHFIAERSSIASLQNSGGAF